MKKIILSPPFSNLPLIGIIYPNTTRIIGTYTLHKRKGLWRVLTTLRKTQFGWLNNVGLRNGGVESIPNIPCIVSISLLNESDWIPIRNVLKTKNRLLGVELNISCPNASIQRFLNQKIIEDCKDLFSYVIVKIPHQEKLERVLDIIDMGVEILHISNTKPTSNGALSGLTLIPSNLDLIENLKEIRPDIEIIGGGGIYSPSILRSYQKAGSDYFSLSTCLLNPIKTWKIINAQYRTRLQKR